MSLPILFFSKLFQYFISVAFHISFRTKLTKCAKNTLRILFRIKLNLQINMKRIGMLTICVFQFGKHSMSFHLFRSPIFFLLAFVLFQRTDSTHVLLEMYLLYSFWGCYYTQVYIYIYLSIHSLYSANMVNSLNSSRSFFQDSWGFFTQAIMTFVKRESFISRFLICTLFNFFFLLYGTGQYLQHNVELEW